MLGWMTINMKTRQNIELLMFGEPSTCNKNENYSFTF